MVSCERGTPVIPPPPAQTADEKITDSSEEEEPTELSDAAERPLAALAPTLLLSLLLVVSV